MSRLKNYKKGNKTYFQEFIMQNGKYVYIRSWKSEQEYLDAQSAKEKDIVKLSREYPHLDVMLKQKKRQKRFGTFDIKDAGDFVIRCNELKPNSVDAIITDPPYPREYLPLYEKLGEVSKFVLKPGGSLVVMIGQSYLPEILNMIAKSLNYQWLVSYQTPGGQSAQLWQRKVNTFWKPVIWFVKGVYEGKWIGDVAKSSVNANEKQFHQWQQSESGMLDLVDRFTKRGNIVLDPFMGSGTTGYASVKLGRHFIGIDIDADIIEIANQRLTEFTRNGK
ncbi:hypothetical protein LCGC14_1326960 [marine sediment metagenome]|uniref:DNA methylase N-4/N-6 domain-containing protein n=1 Tax=marine sediment metagenome TaxID=412755 RepID=A0A0F9NK55_9ZZZZ